VAGNAHPQKEGDTPLQTSALGVSTWTNQDIFLWIHPSEWLNYFFKDQPAAQIQQGKLQHSQVSLRQKLQV